MSTASKMGKLMEMPRKERADRTYQRVVYRRLVDLQAAIRDCQKRETPLGVLAELDTAHLIAGLCELAEIEYRSPVERLDHSEPEPPSIEMVKDVPIIDIADDDL